MLKTQRHIFTEGTSNPNIFSNYTNIKKLKTECVGPLKNHLVLMVEKGEEKVNLLNTFMSTVFLLDNPITDDMIRDYVNSPINVICLTKLTQVQSLLKNTKIDKSQGPGGMHP